MKAIITIDSDAGTFTHSRRDWLGTFPLADLEKWLAFYREQQARYPAHAITYEPDSVVLAEEVRTVGTLP
jgi:hypothetical protein